MGVYVWIHSLYPYRPQEEVVTGFLILDLPFFTIFSLKLNKLPQTTQIIYTLKKSNPKKPFDFLGLKALSDQNRTLEAAGSIPVCSTKKKGVNPNGLAPFLFVGIPYGRYL